MKKWFALGLLTLTLSGCFMTVPVKRNFPAAPPNLLEPVPELKTIDANNPDLKSIIDTSIKNFGEYHVLAERFRAWQEWYQEQKKIFDSVK